MPNFWLTPTEVIFADLPRLIKHFLLYLDALDEQLKTIEL